MVTSSHNPWNWNGVKFKAKFGGSATPAIMKSIEEELAAAPTHAQATQMNGAPVIRGNSAKIEEVDLKPAYVEAVTRSSPISI